MKRFLVPLSFLVGWVLVATPGWLTSYDQALKFAKKTKHPILLNFTGSDWCMWCRRMQKESLGTKEFIQFASTNLLLVELDYPNEVPQSEDVRRANAALKDQFQVTGFPTYILVSPEGKELGRQVGYLKGGTPALVAKIDRWSKAAKPVPASGDGSNPK